MEQSSTDQSATMLAGAERPLVRTLFAAGSSGEWRIARIEAVIGPALPEAEFLAVVSGQGGAPAGTRWTLEGTTSNARYVQRAEQQALLARQAGLGRPEASCAALIPIRKTQGWWDLAQDERRSLFEEVSGHNRIGMDYLPAISRRLYHCRDLGGPFDFLTWFDFAPEHADDFERLVDRLRATREWDYVEREVDVRLVRA